jgi:hypothetical protein
LYVLADALQVHSLKDPVIMLIIEVYGWSGLDDEELSDEGDRRPRRRAVDDHHAEVETATDVKDDAIT